MISAITWNADPRIFTWGVLSPAWYGLLFALALMVAYRITSVNLKKEGETEKQIDKLAWYVILGTIIGARLGHVFFYGPYFSEYDEAGRETVSGYLSHPLDIIKIWEGGLASHGAVLGILIALALFQKYSGIKRSYLWLVDRIAIVAAIGGMFVRLGNFVNSEILGKASDLPWAVVFQRVDDVPRHPAQLYEALCYLVIFFLLHGIYKRYNSKTPDGLLVGVYLITAFTARFLIEFVKEVQVDFESDLPFHMGQFLSIPLVLIGVFLVIRALKQKAPMETESATQ